MDKNSMLYWWDLVKDLPIPKPKTIIIKLEPELVDLIFKCYYETLDYGKSKACEKVKPKLREIFEKMKKVVNELGGFPVFLRTDYTSGKHYSYKNPLYRLDSEKDFEKIWVLICECHEPLNITFLLPPKPHALVLREWLNIETWTSKINHYNKIEVRFFIKDGKITEVYPYYHFSGLAEKYYDRLSEEGLRELWQDYKNYIEVIKNDLKTLVKYALIIAKHVDGYWSLDFAKAGKWYFIDMALGKVSWKPKEIMKEDRELLARTKEISVCGFCNE